MSPTSIFLEVIQVTEIVRQPFHEHAASKIATMIGWKMAQLSNA